MIPNKCELCDNETYAVDSVTDMNSPMGQIWYRTQPLCYKHYLEAKMYRGNTSRLRNTETINGVVYIDGGRASGDCICSCGKLYWHHLTPDPNCPTLVALCDDTIVKL